MPHEDAMPPPAPPPAPFMVQTIEMCQRSINRARAYLFNGIVCWMLLQFGIVSNEFYDRYILALIVAFTLDFWVPVLKE